MAADLTATKWAARQNVLAEVAAERQRQDAKWGEQNHPDGTASRWWKEFGITADTARMACQNAARRGEATYAHILLEEFCEAMEETESGALRAELVQVAAVAVAWIEKIDRAAKAAPEVPRAD